MGGEIPHGLEHAGGCTDEQKALAAGTIEKMQGGNRLDTVFYGNGTAGKEVVKVTRVVK